ILKFAAGNDRIPAAVRSAAMKNLRRGYERLVGYQVADGGFSYWGGDDAADLALTAYAIRFLTDAAPYVDIDRDIVDRAENWLNGRQRSDGSWAEKYRWESTINEARSKRTTTYIARVLSMLRGVRTVEDART